jgi:hypothetical protein
MREADTSNACNGLVGNWTGGDRLRESAAGRRQMSGVCGLD